MDNKYIIYLNYYAFMLQIFFKMPLCIVCKRRNANFRFPKDPVKHYNWVVALGLRDFVDQQSRVCDSHFSPSDWKVNAGGSRTLKPDVVPHCQVPESLPHPAGSGEDQADTGVPTEEEEQGDHLLSHEDTEEEFLATLILMAGTLLLCFLPFLLLWLTSRRRSERCLPAATGKPEYKGWFSPASITGIFQ